MMKMTTSELGYMATQYERFGSITENEIIEVFIDEELEVTIDMLSDYNEYLSEQGFETYFEMSELDEILSGFSPLEIIQKTYFGNFNYSDDYCKFNSYENIDSFSDWQIVQEIKKDRDFLRWYVEENELIDAEDMDASIEYGNKCLKMGA